MTVNLESRSPQNPSDVVYAGRAFTAEDVRAAFDEVRTATATWARAHASERAAALLAAADSLQANAGDVVDLIVREVGKPVTEARQELTRGVNILRYHAQSALDPDGETFPAGPPAPTDTLLMARRRPRGVAGLITPWNFPLAIPLWKAAPALAYGNGVVIKPSPEATAVALRLEELLCEELPEGIFRVTPGHGETGTAVVALADVVSFTGSTTVGADVAVAAARRGIPVQCEMGGLNASIVLPDADPELAASAVAVAAMSYAGQKCTATSRVIVVGDARPFEAALVAAIERLGVGDPTADDTAVGPVIAAATIDQVLAATEEAVGAGARLLSGGVRLDSPGHMVAPTLLADAPSHVRILNEEVFGPVAALLAVKDEVEASRITDSVPYGLVTSVFTSDLDRALSLSGRLRSGMIRVNQPTSGVDFHAPFGGQGTSSYGPREQGKAARDLYTATHTVTLAPQRAS